MECLENINNLYVKGKTNTGKTTTVLDYVKSNNYEVIYTSLQNIKNEDTFNQLINNNNIFNVIHKRTCQRVIIIDNIDYLQNGDKTLLGYIVKYMKQLQKKQNITTNRPKMIFIGTNKDDKKVLEIESLVDKVLIFEEQMKFVDVNKSVKESVQRLLSDPNFDSTRICEKTIVSLVYHENIIKCIDNNYRIYEKFLKNFTHGDYYDRVSFQRQLWQFNEMSFYLKVVDNNNNYHNYHKYEQKYDKIYDANNSNSELDIIFTKILTKYSNEYSNLNFIISCCNKLNCQKSELINMVLSYEDIPRLTKLETKRLQRIFL